jgi:hypothetical protein
VKAILCGGEAADAHLQQGEGGLVTLVTVVMMGFGDGDGDTRRRGPSRKKRRPKCVRKLERLLAALAPSGGRSF